VTNRPISLNITKPFVFPDYSERGWSAISGSVRRFFGDDKAKGIKEFDEYKNIKNLILVVVDGFGWRFVEEFGEKLSLNKRVEEQGKLFKLTSQFPSTTSNCITSLTFDKPLGEHLLYEWNMYHPKVDRMIIPFRFSYVGDHMPERLLMDGYSPSDIFPSYPLSEYLSGINVNPTVIMPRDYIGSSFNTANSVGSRMIPYSGTRQGVNRLRQAVLDDNGSRFFFFYVPYFDSLTHSVGPESKKVRECGIKIFRELYEGLYKRGMKDALLVITADHGHTAISLDRRIYIDEKFPSIVPFIKKTKKGDYILPAGGPRDLFVHVIPEHVTEVFGTLKEGLKDFADVLLVEDCIKAGLFGEGTRLGDLQERMGEILILPFDNLTVWWKLAESYEKDFKGHHGGLSPNEMEIPFFMLPL